MINLLKYYAKKRIIIIGIISIILILLSLIMFQGGFIYGTGEYVYIHNNPINTIGALSIILSIIVPIFEFSFKMRKVGIDEFYKFPIKRSKLFLVKYIVGLLEVVLPIVSFWLFMLIRILLSNHMFVLKYYFLFIIVLIVLIFFIYSIITFIYSKCNTIYDGLICIAFVSLLTFVGGEVIDTMFNNLDVCLYSSFWVCPNTNDFFVFSPITFISDIFSGLMDGYRYTRISESQIISLTVNSLMGIASFVLLITLSSKEKAENSMDISSSWFSYKTLIPIYIVYLSTEIGTEVIFIILIAIMGYIGYAIYRRSFKIKVCDIITMSACIAAGLIIGNINL